MRRNIRLAVALSVAMLALILTPRAACAQEHEENESTAVHGMQGIGAGLGPVLVRPSRGGGPWGAGLRIDGRYAIPVGVVVLAPGARLAGYGLSERFVGFAMPTFRVALPIGHFAPYVIGGVGAGFLSNDSEAGAALLGGGGATFLAGKNAALGLEITYRTITGTEFKSLTLGPSITFYGG